MGMWRLFKSSLSLDYRSLALYRVLMGLVVMADVLYRFPDIANFYTDVGIIPRSIFTSEMTMPWSFSLHLANGSYGFAVTMFIIHFIVGLMLVFGFKTRWAMFAAYLLTVSVHNRNWLVNNGGDDVLRAILFISIFLPLNKYFSVDSALREKNTEQEQNTEHFSAWVLAFFFQAFAIYFVSYILKTHDIWRKDFTAIFYASRLDIFATPIGIWMRDFPFLQRLFTIFTIGLEWLGPLLLVFSFLAGKRWWIVRTIVVVLFWGLHIGILFTMWIGLFPFICLAMWCVFIPPQVWDWLLRRYRQRNFGKIAIYYDGGCGLCKKGVLLLREFFLLPETTLAQAQEFPEINSLMEKKNSWVVVNSQGERFFHSDALSECFKHSPVVAGIDRILRRPKWLNFFNKIYFWVANNRHRLGRVTQFLEIKSSKKDLVWLKWVSEGFGAFIFVTLIMWNLTTIKQWKIKAPFFQQVTRWLHLYQEWNMFAPFPKTDNIWVEIPAVLDDGQILELITGSSDVYGVKDQEFYVSIANEHWRKFYLNLAGRNDYARYYGGYLCRMWNDRNIRWVPEKKLRKFEIIVYSQPNLPDGDRGGISRKSSWKHWCFDEDYKREAKSPYKRP